MTELLIGVVFFVLLGVFIKLISKLKTNPNIRMTLFW